jgi:alkanesulfonate monooxygenase SsuD/methylene tetrahydromethanopterin reductase-like flavin-dependent oxidoreductase (luciferase family)
MGSFTGPVSADSDLYRFRPVAPTPRPLTRRHPPVYAGTSEHNTDLAARHGLPMLFFLHQDPAAMRALVERHSAAAVAAVLPTRHGHARARDGHAGAGARPRARHGPPVLHPRARRVRDARERTGDQPPPEAMGELFLETQEIGPVQLCVERIAARSPSRAFRVSCCTSSPPASTRRYWPTSTVWRPMSCPASAQHSASRPRR